MKARFKKTILNFRFDAGTSRGVLRHKPSYYLLLNDGSNTGIGECSTIKGLSIDPEETYEQQLEELCKTINEGKPLKTIDLSRYPSIAFGLETALLDLQNSGKRILYESDFTNGKKPIAINGLIWMGNPDFMQNQISDKIAQGYRCIKIKIGAIDFETEYNLIQKLRQQYSPNDLEIRLDANGGFTANEALAKICKLARLNIHSLEQPIKKGQIEEMSYICRNSPIPIALDEELIGLNTDDDSQLLDYIQPHYIILKPSLIGGISMAEKWISEAESRHIGWWATSALESNIGLNAIAQWTATKHTQMPQGLGTGQLFDNNIPSPLEIKEAALHYNTQLKWDINAII